MEGEKRELETKEEKERGGGREIGTRDKGRERKRWRERKGN